MDLMQLVYILLELEAVLMGEKEEERIKSPAQVTKDITGAIMFYSNFRLLVTDQKCQMGQN